MSKALEDTLKRISNTAKGDKIYFGDIIRALNSRGFGPLLIALALIPILPTGAIPGVPAICGLFIAFISTQIAWGKNFPWIPEKLKKISFKREKYESGIKRVLPQVKRIDNFFHPRFEFLTGNLSNRIVALCCIALSAAMIIFGFIPMLPAVFGGVILLFGLGLTVHDGLITALGYVLMLSAFILVPLLIQT